MQRQAEMTWQMISSALCSQILRFWLRRALRSPWGQYSVMMQQKFSVLQASWNFTMLGWLMLRCASISVCSIAKLEALNLDRLITLIAKIQSYRCDFTALYTLLLKPFPIRSCSLNRYGPTLEYPTSLLTGSILFYDVQARSMGAGCSGLLRLSLDRSLPKNIRIDQMDSMIQIASNQIRLYPRIPLPQNPYRKTPASETHLHIMFIAHAPHDSLMGNLVNLKFHQCMVVKIKYQMFQIQFVVLVQTQPGEQLRIVGNIRSLGDWNPAHGLPLAKYDDDEWESPSFIEVPDQYHFEFKIVKVAANGSILWEQLPNNSNRKFKAKHNSQLQLKWSSPIGKLVNLAKASYHVKGLPGVMIKNVKETGHLRKKAFDPQRLAQNPNSSSEDQDEEANTFKELVTRKKSADIRVLMNKNDIEQIYYETTDLESASSNRRKTTIYLVCDSFKGKQQFCDQIMAEIKVLHDFQEIHFKWLFFEGEPSSLNKGKNCKSSFQKISAEEFSQKRIHLQKFSGDNTHFIFVDVKSTSFVEVGGVSACLYLPSSEFDQLRELIEDLKDFRFVCFDSAEKNRQIFQFVKEKRYSETEGQNSTNIFEKTIQNVSLEKVIQELHYSNTCLSNVDTGHVFSKGEAKESILEENSILMLDSSLMKKDEQFFLELVQAKCEKRIILIIHNKSSIPEWLGQFKSMKNVFIIFENCKKFYFLEKKYEPLRKHEQILQIMKMKLKILCESSDSCSWVAKDNSLLINIRDNNEKLGERLTQDIKLILKDFKYFRVSSRTNRVKVTWNISHEMRLIRTICRLKYMEEGEIGNFYIISQTQNLIPLKEELKLLVKLSSFYLRNGKHTRVWHYGYGNQVTERYSIKPDE